MVKVKVNAPFSSEAGRVTQNIAGQCNPSNTLDFPAPYPFAAIPVTGFGRLLYCTQGTGHYRWSPSSDCKQCSDYGNTLDKSAIRLMG
jgi:hypothetical protein